MQNKLSYIVIACFIIASCSKENNLEPEVVSDEPQVELNNEPPENFQVTISEIRFNKANIYWPIVRDPENDKVLYSIYLNGILIEEKIESTFYSFENLVELTSYVGKVVATDESGNYSEAKFELETPKYYHTFQNIIKYNDKIINPSYTVISNDDNQMVFAATFTPNYDSSQQEVLIYKMNFDGNVIWVKHYPEFTTPGLVKVRETSDNGFIVITYLHIIKLNKDGDIEWFKTLDCDPLDCEVVDACSTNDGGYIILGRKDNSRDLMLDTNVEVRVSLMKLNQNGEFVWEKKYGNTFQQFPKSIIGNKDNTYTFLASIEVSGRTYQSFLDNVPDDINIWLVTIDEYGNIVWEKDFGGIEDDNPQFLIKTSNDDFVVAGYSTFSTRGHRHIFKISKSGEKIWSDILRLGETDSSFFVTETNDGGYLTTGTFNLGSVNDYLAILKYDNNGYLEWKRTYNDSYATNGKWIIEDNNGQFIMPFYMGSLYGEKNMFIVKSDPFGNFGDFYE
ncbi:hypothetical protein [Algibacter luteus]|uniref:hypothetical protein n=1 Tax=Algibacter luteus TaxID=1178825 RepID=UPI00259AA335|nr:hypothetical protein [Algibacter luteus]WJJ96566.1 hypothetical protein O5O44_15235 [Algibacter luteus]